MPRKLQPPPQSPPPPHVIQPTAVYGLDQARAALGLAKGTLSREIRLGRLRVAQRAGRRFVLGEWLLSWLRAGELPRATPRAAETNSHAAAASNGHAAE
jgi:hypothetical protein